jgi:NADH:ubiquinone oxidoreductase subunit 6 (subunit J)
VHLYRWSLQAFAVQVYKLNDYASIGVYYGAVVSATLTYLGWTNEQDSQSEQVKQHHNGMELTSLLLVLALVLLVLVLLLVPKLRYYERVVCLRLLRVTCALLLLPVVLLLLSLLLLLISRVLVCHGCSACLVGRCDPCCCCCSCCAASTCTTVSTR